MWGGTTDPIVEDMMERSDAILQKIKLTLASWDSADAFESEGDLAKFLEIKKRIDEDGKRIWTG